MSVLPMPGLVADLAPHLQRLVVALLGLARFAEHLLHLRDLAEAGGHPALLAQPPLDLERLLVAPDRFVGPVEPLVGDADRLQDVAARLVVLELDGERERRVQVIERALRIARAGSPRGRAPAALRRTSGRARTTFAKCSRALSRSPLCS